MKTLPDSFTSHGFVHELLDRDGDAAIYARFKVGGGQEHFETIRVRKHNGFKIAGKEFPPAETYPTPEMWGTHGWTYPTAAAARVKFDQIRAVNKAAASSK